MKLFHPGIGKNIGLVAGALLLLCGCEGIDRKHDSRVADIQPPPPQDEETKTAFKPEARQVANFPDLIETMMATRQQYIQQLVELERSFLNAGDSVRADWARRQRELTEGVQVYPYLTTEAPEQRVEVAPIEQDAEADAIFTKAKGLLNEIRGIPMAGHLAINKKKAREAVTLFKQVLREHPKSDKVDDCAFYCGEIYKEYLRDDDPDDELAIRYYKWAVSLDPKTPHAARFQCAVVYDFRRHDRARAIELYHQVLDTEENSNQSNLRFSASRIEQLSDEQYSHLKPEEPRTASARPAAEPKTSDDAGADPKPAPAGKAP